jgi:hypothetical protein
MEKFEKRFRNNKMDAWKPRILGHVPILFLCALLKAVESSQIVNITETATKVNISLVFISTLHVKRSQFFKLQKPQLV